LQSRERRTSEGDPLLLRIEASRPTFLPTFFICPDRSVNHLGSQAALFKQHCPNQEPSPWLPPLPRRTIAPASRRTSPLLGFCHPYGFDNSFVDLSPSVSSNSPDLPRCGFKIAYHFSSLDRHREATPIGCQTSFFLPL